MPSDPVTDGSASRSDENNATRCASESDHGLAGYSLSGLIDMALCLNPQTRVARERLSQAQSAVGLVKATYLPQVSLQAIGGFQRTPLPIPSSLIPAGYFTSDTREFIPSLSAKWVVLDFGRRAGRMGAAEATTDAASAGLSETEEKVAFGVIKAYNRLIAARGKSRSARESLGAAKTEKDAVVDQRRNGRATIVAESQASRALAQAQLNAVKSEGEVDSAYASLLAVIGLQPAKRVEIADRPPGAAPAIPEKALESYLDDALANRPDILVAMAEVRAAAHEEDAAKAEYRPTISMSMQYYQNIGSLSSDGSPYTSVNRPGGAVFVNFEWPLFDGGLRRSQVRIASSKMAEAQDKLEGVRHEAESEVIDAYNAVRTSASEYREALALQDASKVAYEAARDAYKHGMGTFTDLESSRASWVQAQSAVEDAVSDFETARAALALAVGGELALQP